MLYDWIRLIFIVAGLTSIKGYSNYQTALSTPSPTTKPACNDEPRTNAARLKRDLFCGYDSSVRPVPHHSNQTVVKMTALPLSIGWIMEERNAIWMSFWIYMTWKDHLLTWDVSKYDGLYQFYAETGKIWTPDIFVSDPPQSSSINRQMNCAIGSTGIVDCAQSISVSAHCSFDLKYYPFDRHNCRIVFEPRSYKDSELDVDFYDSKQGEALLNMFKTHGTWDLHSLKRSRNVTETYNNVKTIIIEYSFVIQRRTSTTNVMYAAPAFVMVLMVVSVFWLEVQCSARLLLPTLTVVCHLLIIRWLMQVIDANFTNLPVIIVFFRDSLLMTGLALVWSVIARSLYTSSSSPYLLYLATTNLNNSQIVKFLLPQDIFLKSGASGDEDESSLVVHRDCVEQRWRILITLADRLLCGLCLLVYAYLYLRLTP